MIASRSFTAVLVLAALAGVSPSLAEQRSLRSVYDYVIEVSGVVDRNWKVLAPPQQRSQLLLMSPAGDQALLVSVSDKSVRPVDRTLLMSHPDGTVDILAGAVSPTRIIPLVVAGPIASFSVDGRAFALKPRPPLLGPHSLQDLVEDRPSFGEGIKTYSPDRDAVSYLKAYGKPTEIEVFFGSWCSVCEAWVPRLLKSLQQAANAKIQVSLVGVSRDFSTDLQLAKMKGVRALPTFIIRQGGIEVGRIVGAPDKGTVEAALADLLKARSDGRDTTTGAARRGPSREPADGSRAGGAPAPAIASRH